VKPLKRNQDFNLFCQPLAAKGELCSYIESLQNNLDEGQPDLQLRHIVNLDLGSAP